MIGALADAGGALGRRADDRVGPRRAFAFVERGPGRRGGARRSGSREGGRGKGEGFLDD